MLPGDRIPVPAGAAVWTANGDAWKGGRGQEEEREAGEQRNFDGHGQLVLEPNRGNQSRYQDQR